MNVDLEEGLSYEKPDDFMADVDRGIQGDNKGLPNGFTAINDYIHYVQKGRYYLIGADSGVGKCLGKGTKVIMFDGSLKEVENVLPGDQLMGPDSTPRNVLSICTGKEQMYIVRQKRGMDYRVNESHILSLVRTPQNRWSSKILPGQENILKGKRKRSYTLEEQYDSQVVNIPLADYLNVPNKALYQGWKASVDFGCKQGAVDPYFLGLWLGDGTSDETHITTVDREILEYLEVFAKENDLTLRCRDRITYSLTTQRGWINPLRKALQSYGLIGNKHIPLEYLQASREDRLALVAGLVDSDGYYNPENGMVEITQKRKGLSYQVAHLLRSLGFYTTVKAKQAKMTREDGSIYTSVAYRVNFCHCSTIPCKVVRKQSQMINTKPTTTGITVEKDIVDDYYGFTIDGDHLFLLEDFTVTHNTTLADRAFVLEPLTFCIENNLPIRYDYFSFEIGMQIKRASWASRFIFREYGVRMPVDYILSHGNNKVTAEHREMLKMISPDLRDLMSRINFIWNPMTPSSIFKYLFKVAQGRGTFNYETYFDSDEVEKKRIVSYTAHNPDEPWVILVDHIALAEEENGMTLKQTIDRLSTYGVFFRNICNATIVFIQQFNSELGSIERQKFKKSAIAPQKSDFGDSKYTFRDADVVLGLLKPIQFDLTEFMGMDIMRMGDYAIWMFLMKNRYGPTNKAFGLVPDPVIGKFHEIPKNALLQDDSYALAAMLQQEESNNYGLTLK